MAYGDGGGYLSLGSSTTGSGTYSLSGGSLTAQTLVIGDSGRGSFTQTGGTNAVLSGLHRQ